MREYMRIDNMHGREGREREVLDGHNPRDAKPGGGTSTEETLLSQQSTKVYLDLQ